MHTKESKRLGVIHVARLLLLLLSFIRSDGVRVRIVIIMIFAFIAVNPDAQSLEDNTEPGRHVGVRKVAVTGTKRRTREHHLHQ